MVGVDSPIADFYPQKFEIDMDGKDQPWQGICLLPFVDADRLVEAVSAKYGDLEPDEITRNTEGNTLLFVSDHNPLFSAARSLVTSDRTSPMVSIISGW